uniref:PGG domain-containing protein n=1 Tax=Aegilops tauschii subsp. strangulata TaxID=200361 RepID=A0A453GWI2_AEGTS
CLYEHAFFCQGMWKSMAPGYCSICESHPDSARTLSVKMYMDKRLLEAATTGDSTSMKQLAAQNPSILLGTTPQGNNCLHIASIHDHRGFCEDVHAIRNGHKDLALELIAKEPALSQAMTNFNESPMFIAVMRNFQQVFRKLLEIPYSSHGGKNSCNALHAAAKASVVDHDLRLVVGTFHHLTSCEPSFMF